MKKRRWYVWGFILAAFAIVRYVLTQTYMDKALAALDINIIQNYEYSMTCISVILFVICLIGLIVSYCKIFGDLKKEGEKPIYFFPGIIFFSIVKAVADVMFVGKWEGETFYLNQDIDRLKGVEITLGHPAGIATFASVAIAFIQVVFFIILSIILQIVYNKKIKKTNPLE